MQDWLINRENSIGTSKEIYVRGKKVGKIMNNKTNIEKAVKMLKELNVGDDLEFKQAIENILAYIERLEESNTIYALEGSKIRLEQHIKTNYISKQVIKDKIEKLKETLSHYDEYTKLNILEKVNVDMLDAKITILQELLGKE